MFIIDDVIGELVSYSLEPVKGKLDRNPRFLKLLKRLNLQPSEPPKDFEGVYIYTLIEYSPGKPKAILELFGKQEIQQAFNIAFEQDEPNILLVPVEDYVANSPLGEEIKTQGLDCKREVLEFWDIFINMARSTRTPDEVLLEHKLTQIEKSIEEVKDLVQEPVASSGQDTELAKELRSWFTTLGYSFEPYKDITEDYFEWIINISARRGFERILVRGVNGEVGIHDIHRVREVVERNNTDEGWIVAPRRVSRAARDELQQEDNRDIWCYTFDELLDETADFSRYFHWLEQEVKSRAIDTTYVPLGCKKEEVNPKTHERVGVSSYGEKEGWIDGYIDVWLRDLGIIFGAKFIGFNQEYPNIVILVPTDAILVFDIKSKQVVKTIGFLPDVRDANFTNATGLTEELKYWLSAYGAIV